MRAAAFALLALIACDESQPRQTLMARQVTNRDQLIGGLAAVADVGDFLLQNDQIRVMILGGHGSAGPGIFGGSLADADLLRPEREFRAGQGLDSFSELFPFANLATPNPGSTQVTILDSGNDGESATVRVEAKSDNYMDALEILSKTLAVPMNIQMVTDYTLRPHSRVVEIETTLEFNPPNGAELTVPMDPLLTPPSIFDIILRVPVIDNAKPAPGAVAGDYLFYGNKTAVFTKGYGFDLDHKLREIFNGGCDSVNVPVGVDMLAAEGDRVSYAYSLDGTPGGKVYVPLFASSFTAVMTAKLECGTSLSCLGGKRLSYKRLFAIGDGDVGSAQKALWDARNVPYGTLAGHVVDAMTSEPISGARVLVVRDPGADAVSDAALARLGPEESLRLVYAANRRQTKNLCVGPDCPKCSPKEDLYGEPGIVTSLRADRGTDPLLDGDFSGPLEPGKYLVFARDRTRPTSQPQRVTIEAGKTVPLLLALEPPGELTVRISDETGRPSPGKVTLGRCLPECVFDEDCGDGRRCEVAQRRCFPKSGCASGGCRSYEHCDEAGCRCDPSVFLDVSLGDPLNPDHVVATTFAGADGVARLQSRAGDYEIIVSRGPEFDLDRQDVRLDGRRPAETLAHLRRVVDTTGWISADFHVHGILSHDANVTHLNRVRSMMGEGVELVSSADHDAIADFGPSLKTLRAERFLKAQVGLETTTVEIGHFIGFPLRYDALASGGRKFGGRGGAYDWDGLAPGAARFCDLDGDRELDSRTESLLPAGGDASCPEGTILERDGGIIGRLRDLGLYSPEKTVITVPHPRDGFFGYFDQFEIDPYTLLAGKDGSLLELFNPLIKPAFFSTRFDAIELFNGKRYDFVRTPTVAEIHGYEHEMRALRSEGLSNDALESAQGLVGEKWTKEILRRTKDEQARVLASSGKLSCSSKPVACNQTTSPPRCGGTLLCDPSTMECYEACSASDPCPDRLGECNLATSRCEAPAAAPCTARRGVVDDWFRLLNGGFAVTGLANSDTHTLMSVESGLPRNWVRSKSDEPQAIDIGEIAQNVLAHEVLASYGPFVRFDVNGVETGGTLVRPASGVVVNVSVEGPLWFDVDRLEIYRNGELWKIVEAGTDDPECAIVDGLPNRQIVHFSCAFPDAPEQDSWYAAMAMGLRGKDLRPVYTSVPLLFLEIGDITGRAFGAVGLPVGKPEIPRQNPVLPLALTNPVWVDLAGDGFAPPVPLAAESPFSDVARGEFPLTSTAISGTPPLAPTEGGWDPGPAVRLMNRRLRLALHAHHTRGGPEAP